MIVREILRSVWTRDDEYPAQLHFCIVITVFHLQPLWIGLRKGHPSQRILRLGLRY
jgi:hypothetical protein